MNNQVPQIAYTVKYPKIENIYDSRVTQYSDYMQFISDIVLSKDQQVKDFIDIDSFSKWVMVRDVLHQGDAAGSNIYYYCKEFNSNDYRRNNLKMGPLWDYDSALENCLYEFDSNDGWSAQHTSHNCLLFYKGSSEKVGVINL